MIEQIHSNDKPSLCAEWSWMILDLIVLFFGEETIPCMAHHLEHLDNQDMPWPAEP